MEGGSFCRMDDGQFTELLSKKVLEDDVVSVLPFDHQLLLVSARSGCLSMMRCKNCLCGIHQPMRY